VQRKLYNELLAWKQSGAVKPLLVMGARQIGKTYSIQEFAEREYECSFSFNLQDRADIVELFDMNINTQEKVDRLELLIGRAVDFEHTLLFFDEVQQSEKLIEAMKFFAESPRHYNIICAGSLLGVKLKRFKASFPVGKVKLLHMHPMDFEEYLWACGEKLLAQHIRECLSGKKAMVAPLHEKCLGLLRRYLCVGGMPEAVANLIAANNEVLRFDKSILQDIHTSYLADMSKYVISSLEAARIEAVYRSVPSQLGNRSHKFQYSKVRKGAKSRDFDTALDWLIASGMVYACEAVDLPKQPKPPLKGYTNPDTFKLFLNDPGLLGSLVTIGFPDIMLDADFSYKGILAESYVAGQLVAVGVPLLYWREGSAAEVDFLIETPDGIVPIEAKSGANKKSSSLKIYQGAHNPPWSIRITARNFGFVNQICSIPLYAAFAIPALVKR
jgi:predicted AAA+ superfamily ATPase